MAQITTGDINLRTGKANRLNIVELDTTVLTLQQTSLASSNSLVYKSASYSVNSNTNLPNPSQGYFNSRTIQSGIYYPFQDGSSFVLKFSDTDYGYYASASSTNRWWSVLSSVETAYEKRLCISQIGVSYNYWEFKMDSLSFTNSTWVFSGQKILGPTYSNFEPEKQFTIGYRLSGGMTASGNTNSIAGQIIDGYTTLNYPLLSETMYLGDLTSPIEIGVTGSSFSGTGSIVTVGGDGVAARSIVIGNDRTPGKIRIGSGNTFSSSVDIVFAGDGVPCKNCRNEICKCWWGAIFNNVRVNKTSTCPCSAGVNTGWQRPGTVGPIVDSAQSEIIKLVNTDTEDNASIQVDAVVLGIDSSLQVGLSVLSRIGMTLSEYQPDLILYAGRGTTTSHSSENYQVGLGIYNLSTSYLEITSPTYSEDYTPILLSTQYGQIESSTYSVLGISSDAVSVNKINFGDVTNGQSIYVSSGDLYVNDVVFSGGGGSQGPIGPTGAAGSPNYGTQSFTDADIVSVTHSFGRYPIIQVMDTTYDPPQMFSPTKIEYTTIDSFLVTFATSSSGILIYMC